MKALSLFALAAIAGLSSAQTCPVGTGLQVSTNKGCICPSGKLYDAGTPGTCTSDVTACGVSGQFPTTVNTTFDSGNMALTTVNMAGTDTDVTLVLTIPAMSGRNYTNVFVAGPADDPDTGCDALAGTVFKSVTTNNIAASGTPLRCNDQWSFVATFAALRACGFVVSSANNLTTGFQTWDGTIRVAYSEPVTVGTGDDYDQQVTRTATIDFPFRLAFDSRETFEMDASVTVYARQQIDFVILNQVIPRDGSPPTMTLAYTIQYPYAILAWRNSNVLAKSGGAIDATFAGAAPVCASTDYAALATGANTLGTCYQDEILVNFAKNGACSFTGQTFTATFDVGCATGIATTDCPLQATDTSGSAVFTITSDNWCVSGATSRTINNVIEITDFYAANVNNFANAQTAWRAGDRGYFVINFSGLPMNTIKLTGLRRKWSNNQDFSGASYSDVVSPTSGTTDIAFTGLVLSGTLPTDAQLVTGQVGTVDTSKNGGKLGIDTTSRLAYYFSAIYDDNLLGSGAVAAIARGADWFLQLEATVDVTYDTARRRRRRQASAASGQGSIESNQQTISAPEPVTAEAAPSSAVRSAPALALALAVLSAVLMA